MTLRDLAHERRKPNTIVNVIPVSTGLTIIASCLEPKFKFNLTRTLTIQKHKLPVKMSFGRNIGTIFSRAPGFTVSIVADSYIVHNFLRYVSLYTISKLC